MKELQEQHCVRCHATFYDDLDDNICTVPHVFREDPLYLMGGNFTYASECCGESATVTEFGAGTGNFMMDDLATCLVSKHTVHASDVKYNDVNIFKCVRDGSGRCLREVLVQTNEPLFLDWSEGSSTGPDKCSMESKGLELQSKQSIQRYARR